jgi:osmoprotectant transport system ATP-binding protein
MLQYDVPAHLLTRPADPFISRLTGTGDRAMKLLSLTAAGEVAEAGSAEGLTVLASATLRDVLSELLWRGATAATVVNSDGSPCGRLTLAGILAHGRPR